MMRILGIDYGRRRLGLSLSDETQTIASPLPPHTRGTTEDDLGAIGRIIERDAVTRIVIGLPINMNGSHGEMCEEVTQFAEVLEETFHLPVQTFDERMTSMEAERVLIEGNVTRKRRKQLRDGLAAVLILQGFLDHSRNTPIPDSTSDPTDQNESL